MNAGNEQVMRSALAGIAPAPMPADDTMSDSVPATEPMPAPDMEAQAEIDRRITSRIRAGQYAQRRQSREGRYGALRQSLLESPEIAASSGELIQMIFSPINMGPPQPAMIEQQPQPMDVPRSALAGLLDQMPGEVASQG